MQKNETNQSTRQVPVDWEALEDAFENNAPEVHSYLQVKTGEVLRVVDGIADPEMHARIALDANYLRIDPVSSREQYRWMERFIPMVEEREIQSRLVAAIDGKGAFRRFKDVLMSHGPERERWFAFRSERLRVFMEAWLTAHGLTAVARAPAPVEPEASTEEAPSFTAEQLGTRRGRSSETLKKQLLQVVDGLASRDLDKILAFAEFIKARRAARGFSAHSDSSVPARPSAPGESLTADERADTRPDDADPPSQRRALDRH